MSSYCKRCRAQSLPQSSKETSNKSWCYKERVNGKQVQWQAEASHHESAQATHLLGTVLGSVGSCHDQQEEPKEPAEHHDDPTRGYHGAQQAPWAPLLVRLACGLLNLSSTAFVCTNTTWYGYN